jgi:dihydroxyacetone kinase
VGVGLGASVGKSVEVGVEEMGVSVEEIDADAEVPQATKRSEQRDKVMRTFIVMSFGTIIFG